MTDLVERLRLVGGYLCLEAATVIEFKDKDLAALRDAADVYDTEIRLWKIELDRKLAAAEARVETAERELEREREAFQRHEQTLRDNGINSHSEAVVLVDMLRRERDEAREALKAIIAAEDEFRTEEWWDDPLADAISAARAITGEKQ